MFFRGITVLRTFKLYSLCWQDGLTLSLDWSKVGEFSLYDVKTYVILFDYFVRIRRFLA